ncbi:4-alpha-glucanotransferase [Pseudolabrys sp. FHR47]|uniref:4-alpha-glucanotransferase n=1 Tax=Pseudolabrys sp. FHR47 TaxID=2562284 RepID=UPI00143E00EE|nr:4-alpha-glucanotransferase [Pseudolabrys sp. FHR47]
MNDMVAEAERWGIEPGYHDVFGHWHAVPEDTIKRLLLSLRRDGASPVQTEAEPAFADHDRAFQGDGRRVWGLAVQLYALRSARNWGHGDFGDLKRLIETTAPLGAAAIGLNPLHALFPEDAERASPYGPNSRLFLNVLYIDVQAIPEFGGLTAAEQAEAARLRGLDLIDYGAVARLKLAALARAYAGFRAGATAKRLSDFDAFREEQGEALLRFCCFEVLRRQLSPRPWPEWPAPWRTPDKAALSDFYESHYACGFVAFCQWIADRQLAACKETARQLGMPVGLYVDLAVGIDRHGADAWSDQDTVLSDASAGAPPDEFNPAGQDWGLAPFHPSHISSNDFASLRRLLRATMRHAGAVRIDHVLGLKRMFLMPVGAGAKNGAYVRYPFEAMLRVIADESRKARCVVIGEDLGTVPDGFRDTMMRWGLWTYRVLLFERRHDGEFAAPQTYPEQALATFNTHDLPTFRGWITGHDLRTKNEIGVDPGETAEARTWWQGALRRLLGEFGGGRSSEDFAAVAAVLGATPSKLAMVGLDDVVDALDQPNIPGTVAEHPNWRRKLPVSLEELASHAELAAVAEAFAQAGRKT